MMSYRQKKVLEVEPVVIVVGVKLTRTSESRDQNKPDGALEPPRTGSPLTILVDVTLVEFDVADTKSYRLPAPELRIKPKFPYVNRYGNSMTAPPETETLLLIVMVTVPEPVAAFDMTKVVALVTETTVVLAGMFVPVMVCPAPINVVEATVTVVDVASVAESVKTPTCESDVPEVGPNKTGVLVVLSIAVRFCPGCAMKEATTQEIIQGAPITKDFGEHWEIVYMNIANLVENTKEHRILRKDNSLLFYIIEEPKVATGVVFSIDPPRTQAQAFVEFAKGLAFGGFEKLTVSTNLELVLKLLDKAGLGVAIVSEEKNSKVKDLHGIEITLQGGN